MLGTPGVGVATTARVLGAWLLRDRETCAFIQPLLRPFARSQQVEDIEKVMDRDFYMNAQEAIEFGVVDKMLTKRPQESVGS